MSGGNKLTAPQGCYRTRAELENYKFAWIIENFSLWWLKKGTMESTKLPSDVEGMKCSWHLKLQHYSSGMLYVYLFLDKAEGYIPTKGTICLLNSVNTTIFRQEVNELLIQTSYVILKADPTHILEILQKDDMLKIHVALTISYNFLSSLDEEEEDSELCVANSTKSLESLLIDPKYSDVVLVAEGKEIEAHRNILATTSVVFEAMFKHHTLEKTSGRIIIKDFDFDTVKALVYFMYTGKPPEKLETALAMSLLQAADKYDLQNLKNVCAERLFSCVNVSTALDILSLANMYNIEWLRKKALNYIFDNRSSFDFQPLTLSEGLGVESNAFTISDKK